MTCEIYNLINKTINRIVRISVIPLNTDKSDASQIYFIDPETFLKAYINAIASRTIIIYNSVKFIWALRCIVFRVRATCRYGWNFSCKCRSLSLRRISASVVWMTDASTANNGTPRIRNDDKLSSGHPLHAQTQHVTELRMEFQVTNYVQRIQSTLSGCIMAECVRISITRYKDETWETN